MPKLYRLPHYYDIAFTYDRDIPGEAVFLQSCFRKHARIEINNILEPACGSGMYLVEFARLGYRITGYDISTEMVEYARETIRRKRVEHLADVVEGDMKSIRFDRCFDAAVTLISSLSYLNSDTDLSAHFRIMSETVRTGGVYIVEVFFACNDLENEKYPYETWKVEHQNLSIDVSWKLENYNLENKTRNITLNMDVIDRGERLSFEERHSLRLWLFEDLTGFCRESGFRIEGIYTQQFTPVPSDVPITGELGALYLALVKE
jgi:SAM-dependent methyltransferase